MATSMSSTDVVADTAAFVSELVPENDVTEAPEEKADLTPEMDATQAPKKKKKQKGVDIFDMYSFDPEELAKAKPAKKKKEPRKEEPTQEDIMAAMIGLAKIVGEEEEGAEGQEGTEGQEKKVKEEASLSSVLHRFPSPSRSRKGASSDRKEALSPERKKSSMKEELASSPLKATAPEFVPPGFSSPLKGTSDHQVGSSMKATASEFVPPEFSSPAKVTSSLQAHAAEFIPPEFETKVVEPTSRIEEKEPCFKGKVPPGYETKKTAEKEPSLQASATEFIPPEFATKKVIEDSCTEEKSSSESLFTNPLFTPPDASETGKQPSTKPVDMPALKLNTCEPSGEEDAAKWSSRVEVKGILGKVKQSLTTFSLGSLRPSSKIGQGANSKDPCIGKVQEKVQKIEEKEADNEAEKEREAAIKAINEKMSAQKKEFQMKMDDTLLDCFLQAVTTRVKDRNLPIMGTALYGHMRLCRFVGTSCDVKDSSYVWMRSFLEHLEEDGLLKLKPGVKDPTVTWINRTHHIILNFEPWDYKQTVGARKEGCYVAPGRR